MSKPMRAKMRVTSVENLGYADVVKMTGVYGGSTNAEDNTYAKASPAVNLTIQIDNPALKDVYKPEDTFYVDFIPVPKPT
jgi:hypothetical protein